jgi:transposase
VVRLAELIVILELHQRGMIVSAIARRTGLHRITVAKYLARGIEPPAYGPRSPRPTKGSGRGLLLYDNVLSHI